jgi:hypothetical protein
VKISGFIIFAVGLLFISIQANSQDQQQLLEKAYKTRSVAKLKQFFENWRREIPPASDSEINSLKEDQREAYKVFEAFYHPDSLELMGFYGEGSTDYNNVVYFVVQNSIDIKSVDKIFITPTDTNSIVSNHIMSFINDSAEKANYASILKEWKKHKIYYDESIDDGVLTSSIQNFRPSINCGNKHPLFYREKYAHIFDRFLGNAVSINITDSDQIVKSRRAMRERHKFLDNYIKIYGKWYHDKCYWVISTLPNVDSITFDHELKTAKLTLTFIYGGGEAILKKVNGKWKIVTAKRTWIE